jgi:hypothetical protein
MRRWLAFLIFLGILILPLPAQAAGSAIKISSFQVELWPEFDKPNSVLVINYITLSADTSLPATLVLHLPPTADGPSALAVGATMDTVSDQGIDYSVQQQTDTLNLTIKAKGPAIHLEYYDPIQRDGKTRKYPYKWITDYAVGDFKLTVQQPIGAKTLQFPPALTSSEIRNDNMKYFSHDFGAQSAGTSILFSVGYEKSSDALSISSLQVQPSQPLGSNTSGTFMSSVSNAVPYLLGGLGLLLIGGCVFYFWQLGGGGGKNSNKRRSPRVESEADSEMYCHQCGTRAHKGDRFCRICGTKLRHEA